MEVLRLLCVEPNPELLPRAALDRGALSNPSQKLELNSQITHLESEIRTLVRRELEEPTSADLIADVRREKSRERIRLKTLLKSDPEATPTPTPEQWAALGEELRSRVMQLAGDAHGPTARQLLTTLVTRIAVTTDRRLEVTLLGNLSASSGTYGQLQLQPSQQL